MILSQSCSSQPSGSWTAENFYVGAVTGIFPLQTASADLTTAAGLLDCQGLSRQNVLTFTGLNELVATFMHGLTPSLRTQMKLHLQNMLINLIMDDVD